MAIGYTQVRQLIGRNSGATATTPAGGGAALDQAGQYAVMELAVAPPYLLSAVLQPDRRRIVLTFSGPVWSLADPAAYLDQTGEPLSVESASGSTITVSHPTPLGPGTYTLSLVNGAGGDGNYGTPADHSGALPTASGSGDPVDGVRPAGAVREVQVFRRRTRR